MKYRSITISKLETSAKEETFLLCCNRKYYRANKLTVELLHSLQKYENEKEGISAFVEQTKGLYTYRYIEEVVKRVINPLLEGTNVKANKSFLYERKFLSADSIDKFSCLFSFLFEKKYIYLILASVLIADVCFFFQANNLMYFDNTINLYHFIGIFLFVFSSSFFHELGHASSCKYFGLRHGDIGFGLYLNIPVLYTDVTEIWKLKRKQRIVVNLAGIYFQSFFLLGLIIGFFISSSDILRYLILIMNFGFLMTLNPFFKFDGYWIMSDLLGIPNLRDRSKELLVYIYNCIRKKSKTKSPYLLEMRKKEKWGFFIYSLLVNLFMGFYLFYVIPRFLFRFIQGFPTQIEKLNIYLSSGLTPPFALVHNLGVQLIFLILIIYFLSRSVLLIKRNVRH